MLWAYTRKIELDNQTADKCETLFKVGIFGDAFDIPLLHNETINSIHQHVLSTWTFSVHCLKLVYENTPSENGLRRYIVELVGKTGGSAAATFKTEHEKYWCYEALVDLVKVVWALAPVAEAKETVAKWDLCRFHQHEKDVACKKEAE